MNKTYIIKYAQELLDLKYIAGFDTGKDKKNITIEFLTSETIEDVILPSLTVGTPDSANQLKLGIREILNRKKIVHISVEEIYELINTPGVNKLNLSTSAILGNLQYTLRARKGDALDSVIGYLRLAIGSDWFGDYLRKKSKKAEICESQISIGLDDPHNNSILKPSVKNELRREIFEKYLSNLSEQELEEKFQEYGVKGNVRMTVRKQDLRLKLFKAGILSID